MSKTLRAKWRTLQDNLKSQERVLVAFSGGCDSMLVLAAARRILSRESILAVTAMSPSLPARERQATQQLASLVDVHHQFLDTYEVENPAYAANPSNRCFFCKDELFGKLAPLAQEKQMTVVDGFNASDRSDYRPGFQAAQKWNVMHPLNEAELSKEEIRMLSRWLTLPTWNKPASPCLSSRIPYGTPVSSEVLGRIERAEDVLHAEGFRIVRVRHHGNLARIEVPLDEFARLTESNRWSRVTQQLQSVGYQQVEADPRGFESGRLNAALTFSA